MDYAVKYYKIVNVASEITDIFSLLEKGRRTPRRRGCQGEEFALVAWLPPRVIADIFSVLEKGRRTPWRLGCLPRGGVRPGGLAATKGPREADH